MRNRYVIKLETLEPLLIGHTQSMGNYRASQSVIPGQTWRGAVAQLVLKQPGSQFSELFEVQPQYQVYFGPLFPGRDEANAFKPPTLFSCKYYPGPVNAGGHGVFDVLARQYALEVATHPDQPILPGALDDFTCIACGHAAEPYTEFDVELTHHSSTHVAINRRRQAAEEGMLYTREGVQLPSGTGSFTGWVDVPAHLTERIGEVLAPGTELSVGANRSRGMGLCVVKEFYLWPGEPTLSARIADFNDTLFRMLSYYQAQTQVDYPQAEWASQDCFFTIDLRSPAILRSGFALNDIWRLPVFEQTGVAVERLWIDRTLVGGWHAKAHLPRRAQPAITGVILCRFTGEVDIDAIATIEQEGLGSSREKGYGQLQICSPAHNATGF